MKHVCFKCSSLAVWMYGPMDRQVEAERYYCDTCIKRGCSCNLNFETGEELVDDQGRLYPCCEYIFCEEGFELDPS